MRATGERFRVWLDRAGRRFERPRRWLQSFDFTLARRFGLATRDDRTFYLLVAAVGVLAGVLGLALHALIDALQRLLWGSSDSLVEVAKDAPPWLVVAAPAAGGLLVGLIYWLSRQPAAGGGMSALMEAVALSGGKTPLRPAIVNALAAVATVGSGGALGREGPMIRLGAALSSWMGDSFGLPAHRIKILVGCGAAAGLASAYNIPVGGAIFAMEVILGNFALEIFGPIVVSSVISTLISRAVAGDVHRYAAPEYALVSGWEILAYAGLGVVGAIASVVFIRGVGIGRRLFARQRFIPKTLQPAIGMALLGALGIYAPYVLGGGQDIIGLVLAGKLELPDELPWVLLALPAAKLLATTLTVGSGGAGGLFTPTLFFGALIGGAYGFLVNSLWPDLTSPYGAYAAVGMAAIAAGTSHAPISAILILFEFTGNYDLILPLMLSAIGASMMARRIYPYSIYTESLRDRGVDLAFRMEEAVLAGLKAADLARPDPDVLRPNDPYQKVVESFLSARRQRLFVVGEDGRLLGAVSLHDIKHMLEHPETVQAVVAHDLMEPVDAVISTAERLHRAVQVFAHSDYERLPVVDAKDGTFFGVLSKRDVLAVYAQEVLGRPALLATFVSSRDAETSRDYVELPPDFAMRMVPVPEQLVGNTLAEARLPQTLGARVIELLRQGARGEERVIPAGDTRLLPGDRLILMGPTRLVEALREGEPVPELEVDEAGAHRQID